MAAVEDLWPDLTPDPQSEAPVTMLRQQAALLAGKTNDVLRSEVATITGQGRVRHDFVIHAPLLDHRQTLFQVSYDIAATYPVVGEHAGSSAELRNAEALHAWLKKMLCSEQTRRAIQSLLAASLSAQHPG